jgi:hypothetical protein
MNPARMCLESLDWDLHPLESAASRRTPLADISFLQSDEQRLGVFLAVKQDRYRRRMLFAVGLPAKSVRSFGRHA